MGCGASTRRPNENVSTGEQELDEESLPMLRKLLAFENDKSCNMTEDKKTGSSLALSRSQRSLTTRTKSVWLRSFIASDPRHGLADFFKPGDERGPFGYLRAQGLRPCGAASEFFSVWRPTSITAIRMLFDGTATGKGLNVKGKSALKGPLSGFVPFLQISEEKHKAFVGSSPPWARTHIYFRNPVSREKARKHLQAVMLEMEVGARQAARQLKDVSAGTLDLTPQESDRAAHQATAWRCDCYELRKLNDHQQNEVYGLDMPERVMWEAFVVRQDITYPPGWETGRASEPAFMDLNLHAVRDQQEPRAVVWQDDGTDPMNPTRLLIAHDDGESIKPVASDIDAFLIGSKGMKFADPIPADQVKLMQWQLEKLEDVLKSPNSQGWTKRWLEVLKNSHPAMGSAKMGVEMPKYGFGDPQSYDIMAKAVQKLRFCGAVRHVSYPRPSTHDAPSPHLPNNRGNRFSCVKGAECFNFWFPQELDTEFLVVWGGFLRYGSAVPWRYVNQAGLKSFLYGRLEEGFAFPLNPKCKPSVASQTGILLTLQSMLPFATRVIEFCGSRHQLWQGLSVTTVGSTSSVLSWNPRMRKKALPRGCHLVQALPNASWR